MRQITLTLSRTPGDNISYRCTNHGLCYSFAKYFCLQLGFVEFSLRIWIVVFFSFISLSPVGLFCECCRMSLLLFLEIDPSLQNDQFTLKLSPVRFSTFSRHFHARIITNLIKFLLNVNVTPPTI